MASNPFHTSFYQWEEEQVKGKGFVYACQGDRQAHDCINLLPALSPSPFFL